MATKFGILNASWLDSPDPAEAFEVGEGDGAVGAGAGQTVEGLRDAN